MNYKWSISQRQVCQATCMKNRRYFVCQRGKKILSWTCYFLVWTTLAHGRSDTETLVWNLRVLQKFPVMHTSLWQFQFQVSLPQPMALHSKQSINFIFFFLSSRNWSHVVMIKMRDIFTHTSASVDSVCTGFLGYRSHKNKPDMNLLLTFLLTLRYVQGITNSNMVVERNNFHFQISLSICKSMDKYW